MFLGDTIQAQNADRRLLGSPTERPICTQLQRRDLDQMLMTMLASVRMMLMRATGGIRSPFRLGLAATGVSGSVLSVNSGKELAAYCPNVSYPKEPSLYFSPASRIACHRLLPLLRPRGKMTAYNGPPPSVDGHS